MISTKFTSVPAEHIGGLAEVASELGCAKQQLYSLRRRKDFPPVICELAATPIWDLRDIRDFGRRWKRHSQRL